MKALLEGNDGDALDALADVETAFAGAADRKLLDSLRERIVDFNLDAARSKLRAIANSSGWSAEPAASPASAR